MKQAVIEGERRAAVVEVPEPRAAENLALVKITVAPMCTEYKAWVSGSPGRSLGHEAVGEVVEVAQPGRVKVGDRVVVQPQYPCGTCRLCVAGDYIHCQQPLDVEQLTGSPSGRATMAQYLVKPDWLLSPIPDDVTDERAGLALCCLGPSMGAFELADVGAFDTVLIAGLGPVGLGAVANAVFRGARVIAVEPNVWRADLARELGAEAVLDPGQGDPLAAVRELTDGGVDVALDCAGPKAHRLLLDATRRKGRVAFVAAAFEETTVKVTPDLVQKGLSLYGAWHYNLNAYPKVIQVIRGFAKIDKLVSHVFALDDIQEAFATLAGQATAKVMLRPWG